MLRWPVKTATHTPCTQEKREGSRSSVMLDFTQSYQKADYTCKAEGCMGDDTGGKRDKISPRLFLESTVTKVSNEYILK